ncbi:hypothetical protein GCM10009836_12460 [Pseudonocardia ailaonensis]|uniref:histidine kinase n=1 Tax=Pseudonocardia ailaonensis TaxID=367279 RepID=A0ABN2MRL3_9PSEU
MTTPARLDGETHRADGLAGTDRPAIPSQPTSLLIVAFAVVLGAVAAGGVAAAKPDGWWDATEALVGLLYVGVGVVARNRRPANGMGLLICVTGLLFLLATLFNGEQPVMVLLGVFGGQAVLAGVLHLLLAFPSGRLAGRADRALVLAGYLSTVVPLFVQYAVSGNPGVLLPWPAPGAYPEIAALADLAHRVVATAVLLTAAVVLARRWRAARSPAQRRSRALVSLWGIGVLVAIPVSALVVAPAAGMGAQALFLVQLGLLSTPPLVIAAAILRGGFARTLRIEELGRWLGVGATEPVRTALAVALGDDSVQLHYPGPDGALMDADGRTADPPPGARTTIASRDGTGVLAVITYDDALIADPSTVEQAGRVVALALEGERLTAELLARGRELRESRARLVEIADVERRTVAQDLHDTLQGRLVLATLRAGTLAERPGLDERSRRDAEALRAELTDGIAEVRRLVHGLMPALLLERGLHTAAEDLLDRSPIPVDARWHGPLDALPPAVSTGAYFILAEALANAVKHSGASRIRVRMARTADGLELDFADDGIGGIGGLAPTGAGLRGLRDRVDVLGGHLALAGPAGGGTTIEVRLPCAS